jgi:formate dehydrogenase subunit beta
MSDVWSIDTHGDPLGKVRDFITHIWLEAGLTGMLVTMNEGNDFRAIPHFISEVSQVNVINPFKPLMEINAARMIPGLLADYPGSKIGALLRPCEMRALIEMTKLAAINIDDLLTISVDCLGTLPADEYQWRLDRIEKTLPDEGKNPADATDELAREALKFARQGGITPYRYRSACQVCTSPAAEYADINIQILGLPVRQQILVMVKNPSIYMRFHMDKLVDGRASENLVLQHERLLSRMNERHQRTMEHLNEALGELLPADVDGVIHQLESCGNCQTCMGACPICSIHRPTRSADGHFNREEVMRWLVSCAGCGMCEQSCPDHLPIYSIFAHIRQQLDQQWEYIPGRSLDEPLPLI